MTASFHGGIHPPDKKNQSAHKAVEELPLLSHYYIPLKQHIGEACVPLVSIGESVKKGQCLANGTTNRSVPVHAPTSGIVKDISLQRDPLTGRSLSIIVESDGKDEWLEGLLTFRNFEQLSPQELLGCIRNCGVVGMGGAAFPTHIKLSPPPEKKIDMLIINGAECEPYLTSDYRAMLEHSHDIIRGCQIAMKILGVTMCSIGIEENKPKAIALIRKHAQHSGVKVVALPTRYPQGGEKNLIRSICGREVLAGKLPLDVGCVVQNVSTCKAIADAVEKNIPLIERIVTVSGGAIAEPKNIRSRIGAQFSDLIAFCKGYKHPPSTILMGGPMMGISQADTDAPVIKSSSGILAFTRRDTQYGVESPCIRCGRCLDVCTMRLRPNMLGIISEQRKYQTALLEYDLLDCVECGCCTYVCPAKRNIVQYVRLAKAKNALFTKAGRKQL